MYQKEKRYNFLREEFFDIMRVFGSILLESESTFPFQYNIIFETYQFLEPRSSSPEKDRRVRPLTFLYKIQF